jgi:hypothetical protein
MFPSRFRYHFLSAGLAVALTLALAPASAHGQGCRGPGMSGGSGGRSPATPSNWSPSPYQATASNCSPSRYQLLVAAQLQTGMYQQALAYPALAYQQAGYGQAMQQQMAYSQVALMMNAQQYQQQQLQMMNAPPGTPAPAPGAFAAAGFVDPLLRPAVAAAPAPVAPPAAMRDPFARPVAVRDQVRDPFARDQVRDPLPVVRDPAPVREIPGLEVPPLRSKEEEAASKLKLAKLLDRDGLSEKARMRYNEIAEKFPGTKAAEEAESLLAKK